MPALQPTWEAHPPNITTAANTTNKPSEHSVISNKLYEEMRLICICLVQMPVSLNDKQREHSERGPWIGSDPLESLIHHKGLEIKSTQSMEHLMCSFPHGILMSMAKGLWEVGI